MLRGFATTRVDRVVKASTLARDERHAKVAAPLASPRLVARGGPVGCPTHTASRSVRASVVASRAALVCRVLPAISPDAKGWRMLRVAVPEEDDEPILAAYCPYCAEREFGLARRTDSARTDPE